MEDILELLFTLVIEIVNTIKFKNPKTRTGVVTVVMSLLFAILSGTTAWGAVGLFQQGSIAGSIVLGVITLAAIVIGLIIIVRGHKTNWEKY